MVRRPLIIGAQKLYLSRDDSVMFVQDLRKAIEGRQYPYRFEIGISPSFINLATVSDLLMGTCVYVGAQNVHQENNGAFTGQVSLKELLPLRVKFIIVGHSELRAQQRETNEEVNRKVKLCLKNGVMPIVCVGESREEKEAGKSEAVIEHHIKAALAGVSLEEHTADKFVIAYEPLWAIKAGRDDKDTEPATAPGANEIHNFIRQIISQQYGETVGQSVRVIYGGSVNADNAKEFLRQPSVDGLLIGTASVELNTFLRILDASDCALFHRS
jgi:triosephosphate isomerase